MGHKTFDPMIPSARFHFPRPWRFVSREGERFSESSLDHHRRFVDQRSTSAMDCRRKIDDPSHLHRLQLIGAGKRTPIVSPPLLTPSMTESCHLSFVDNETVSETEIINVVERRVWHAMEEGQFENLPGQGKPLDLTSNPHMDPAEDTLYRILNKNGCAPEWVELNKDIRSKISEWRLALKKFWMFKGGHDDSKRVELSESLKLQLPDLNNLVFRYNLVVPFGLQMFGFKWEKELDRLQEETQVAK